MKSVPTDGMGDGGRRMEAGMIEYGGWRREENEKGEL
jgi:hypothetical protein